MDKTLTKVNHIIEKPTPEKAPSDLAVAGRYILYPEIFKLLEQLSPGRGGEIQLTDAISQLLQTQNVYGLQFDGLRYDCGSKLGYVKATIEYALKHAEIGEEFKMYLDNMNSTVFETKKIA
jgi:UTP--glucose-1-phosphate uridylyltransferase